MARVQTGFPDAVVLHNSNPPAIRPHHYYPLMARSGGGIFCMASAFPDSGVHLGLGTIISSSANGDKQDEGGGSISTVLCDVRYRPCPTTRRILLGGGGAVRKDAVETRYQRTPDLLVMWH